MISEESELLSCLYNLEYFLIRSTFLMASLSDYISVWSKSLKSKFNSFLNLW